MLNSFMSNFGGAQLFAFDFWEGTYLPVPLPVSCVYNNVCFYESCRSCVRIVTSDRAGMGKSLCIKRLREALETQSSIQPLKVVVPMHGPVVTADTVMKALEKHFGKESATIFHLDIAPSVCYYIIVLCCVT